MGKRNIAKANEIRKIELSGDDVDFLNEFFIYDRYQVKIRDCSPNDCIGKEFKLNEGDFYVVEIFRLNHQYESSRLFNDDYGILLNKENFRTIAKNHKKGKIPDEIFRLKDLMNKVFDCDCFKIALKKVDSRIIVASFIKKNTIKSYLGKTEEKKKALLLNIVKDRIKNVDKIIDLDGVDSKKSFNTKIVWNADGINEVDDNVERREFTMESTNCDDKEKRVEYGVKYKGGISRVECIEGFSFKPKRQEITAQELQKPDTMNHKGRKNKRDWYKNENVLDRISKFRIEYQNPIGDKSCYSKLDPYMIYEAGELFYIPMDENGNLQRDKNDKPIVEMKIIDYRVILRKEDRSL